MVAASFGGLERSEGFVSLTVPEHHSSHVVPCVEMLRLFQADGRKKFKAVFARMYNQMA